MKMDPETHRILRELDVDAAEALAFRHTGFTTDSRKNSLAGIHKARIAARKAFTKDEVDQSRKWLSDNGFRDTMFGRIDQ